MKGMKTTLLALVCCAVIVAGCGSSNVGWKSIADDTVAKTDEILDLSMKALEGDTKALAAMEKVSVEIGKLQEKAMQVSDKMTPEQMKEADEYMKDKQAKLEEKQDKLVKMIQDAGEDKAEIIEKVLGYIDAK